MSSHDALHVAASNGDADSLASLIPSGFHLSTDSGLLADAAQRGHAEVVALLLRYVPDVTGYEEMRRWHLFLAASAFKALSVEDASRRADTLTALSGHQLLSTFHICLEDALAKEASVIVDALLAAQPLHFATTQVIELALRLHSTRVVAWVLSQASFDPRRSAADLLQSAVNHRHAEGLELLLGDHRFDPSEGRCIALRTAARAGSIDMIDVLLRHPRIDPASDAGSFALAEAATAGQLAAVERLLAEDRIRPDANDNAAICTACHEGHVPIVERLLEDPRVNPGARNNEPLRMAAARRKHAIVALLLRDRRVDPSAQHNAAVRSLARNGEAELLKLALADPRVDPAANNSELLLDAVNGGHAGAVEVLLADGRVHPSAGRNAALHAAVKNGHVAVLQRLLAVHDESRVDLSLDGNALFAAASTSTQPSGPEMLTLLMAAAQSRAAVSADVAVARDNDAFRAALRAENADSIAFLLAQPMVDASADDNAAIRLAAKRGWLPIVETLLADSRVDPAACDNEAIRTAAAASHRDVVLRLLQDSRVDPSAGESEVFRTVAEADVLDVPLALQLLADPRVDPGAKDSAAFRKLAWSPPHDANAAALVQALLAHPRVNPGADDSAALCRAVRAGNLRLTRQLLAHPLVDPAAAGNRALRFAVRDPWPGPAAIEIFEALWRDERVDVSEVDGETGDDTLSVALRYSAPDHMLRLLFRVPSLVNRQLRKLEKSSAAAAAVAAAPAPSVAAAPHSSWTDRVAGAAAAALARSGAGELARHIARMSRFVKPGQLVAAAWRRRRHAVAARALLQPRHRRTTVESAGAEEP